jgi:hypothetical protein
VEKVPGRDGTMTAALIGIGLAILASILVYLCVTVCILWGEYENLYSWVYTINNAPPLFMVQGIDKVMARELRERGTVPEHHLEPPPWEIVGPRVPPMKVKDVPLAPLQEGVYP